MISQQIRDNKRSLSCHTSIYVCHGMHAYMGNWCARRNKYAKSFTCLAGERKEEDGNPAKVKEWPHTNMGHYIPKCGAYNHQSTAAQSPEKEYLDGGGKGNDTTWTPACVYSTFNCAISYNHHECPQSNTSIAFNKGFSASMLSVHRTEWI